MGGPDPNAPRVLLSFPTNPNDLLLSGLLIGGDALTGRAVAIDAPIGKGHVVMFANRPYWRGDRIRGGAAESFRKSGAGGKKSGKGGGS